MADDGDRATAAPFPNGPETAGRAPDGRFAPGNLGGPGRPRGSRHRAQAALDAIGEAGAAEVLQAVVAAARGGDMRAASILLDRVWPARKGRAVETAELEARVAALEECAPGTAPGSSAGLGR